MSARWAVFMDKDGTLLEDVPYNVEPREMRFATGAEAGLRLLGRLEVPLVVVSNQPGIAHGRFREDELSPMTERLRAMFADCGARLAAFYHCPHHPGGIDPRYAITCQCRKPSPGLLRQAAADHAIDLGGSWMIGDILDDIEAGARVRCRSILVDHGSETLWQFSPWRIPDYIVTDLLQAAAIVRNDAGRSRCATRAAAARR